MSSRDLGGNLSSRDLGANLGGNLDGSLPRAASLDNSAGAGSVGGAAAAPRCAFLSLFHFAHMSRPICPPHHRHSILQHRLPWDAAGERGGRRRTAAGS